MSDLKRDIQNLSRAELLEDYSQRAQRGDDPVVRFALSNSSTSARDILVVTATDLGMSSEELKTFVLNGNSIDDSIIDPDELADLGRLALLQNKLDNDAAYGEMLLTIALNAQTDKPISFRNRLVLLQHYILTGQVENARHMIQRYPDLEKSKHGFLPAELDNPYTHGTFDTKDQWLDAFNRVFTENELSPVKVVGDAPTPFDGLRSSQGKHSNSIREPLVSVVLTSYQPDRTRLMSSINSIMNQTWRNLELIVVDDASGAAYQHIFEEIDALDERIKVIHAGHNGGTYIARNIGYAAAAGELITGQDDDDWSHPERIAQQVSLMTKNPDAIGCRVKAVRCDESLNRIFLGKLPVGQNASSLMISRAAYEASGGYLPVRKAGDTEFHRRIEAIFGRSVLEINKPLSIIRILSNSLSRGDFRPGWMHESRYSFRSSYSRWHETSSPQELKLTEDSVPPIHVPDRLGGNGPASFGKNLDVVFAGDWQSYGGPQKSMLEEITALRDQGLKVGVLHLESARFMYRRKRRPLNSHIQDLINTGAVREVFYDEDIAIRLLILRYPPILQFFRTEITSLSMEQMLIIANQAPAELDGSDIRYLVSDVDRVAREQFGISPNWVPQGPQIRNVLIHYLRSPALAEFDMPGILDPSAWWLDRLWYRSKYPVIGRHSRDNEMKWPDDRTVLEAVYPTDGSHDVRIMGGARAPLAVLNKAAVPRAWTVYKTDECPVRTFLYSLDYFVYFQHSYAIEAFGRAILEAIASGVVVILPPHFEEVFGEAAIYAEPEQVASIIGTYHADFSVYQQQLRRSREVLWDKFSHESYRQRITSILMKR